VAESGRAGSNPAPGATSSTNPFDTAKEVLWFCLARELLIVWIL